MFGKSTSIPVAKNDQPGTGQGDLPGRVRPAFLLVRGVKAAVFFTGVKCTFNFVYT
jgi:hypothetical protein